MYVLSPEYYADLTSALAVARAMAASPPVHLPERRERPLVYIYSPLAGNEEVNSE